MKKRDRRQVPICTFLTAGWTDAVPESTEVRDSVEQLRISIVRLRDSQIIEDYIEKNLVARKTYVIGTVVLPDETINI